VNNTLGDPEWEFGEPVGPFTRYILRQSPGSNRTHTLRYMAPTSADFDKDVLAKQLAQIAPSQSWSRKTPPASANIFERYTMRYSWFKQAQRDRSRVEISLMADGGLETTSLFCVDVAMKEKAEEERATIIEKRLRKAREAAEQTNM